MRTCIAAIASVCLVGSVAIADAPDPPAHPPTTDLPSPAGDDAQPQPPAPVQVTPPAPVLAPPLVAPPIVTISTMPVTRTVPGYWDDEPRTSAWISTGVTVGFVAATIGWWMYESRFTFAKKDNASACVPDLTVMGMDRNNCNALIIGEDPASLHKQHEWNYVFFSLGAVTAASAFITSYMWARHHHSSREVIDVAPVAGGARLSVTHSF